MKPHIVTLEVVSDASGLTMHVFTIHDALGMSMVVEVGNRLLAGPDGQVAALPYVPETDGKLAEARRSALELTPIPWPHFRPILSVASEKPLPTALKPLSIKAVQPRSR